MPPQIGPANMASNPITAPTAMPAVIPFSAAPVETLRITNMRIAVRINSRTNDCIADQRATLPQRRVFWKQKPQDATSRERSCTLTQDVWN